MPIIRIDLWEGRTDEVKEKLIANVTKTVCDTIGCPAEVVEVIIDDVKRSNWGIGGKPASKIKP
jgi:4-oxalocrotonate tautomerase